MTDLLPRIFPGADDPKGVERVQREDGRHAATNIDDELADLAEWRRNQAGRR